MMKELVAAAKNSLGLYSIWIDDEQYEAIINAVLEKVVEMGGGQKPAPKAPEGWSIIADGDHLIVSRPDGTVSEWFGRPENNGTGMYDLCMALVAT